MVSASGSEYGGPRFEFRSDHHLDLFLGRPEFKSLVTSVNDNLVVSCQLGLNYLFKNVCSRVLVNWLY